MRLEVLIVDDDEVALFLVKSMVVGSELSPRPLTFSNGEASLKYIRERYQDGLSYLILLDINMPVMDGWEFLEKLRLEGFTERIYVVVASSSVNGRDRERSSSFDLVIGYLEKPIKLDGCRGIMKLKEMSDFYD